MNPYVVFQSGTFQTILTVMVPGFVAAGPFCVLGYLKLPLTVQSQVFSASVETWVGIGILTGLLVIALIFAAITREMGSRLEVCLDKRYAAKHHNFYEEWRTYLQREAKDQLIADEYLHTILDQYRFELNFSAALLLLIAGIVLDHVCGGLPLPWTMGILVVVAILFCYFFFCEARATQNLLAKTRRTILNRPGIPGDSGAPRL